MDFYAIPVQHVDITYRNLEAWKSCCYTRYSEGLNITLVLMILLGFPCTLATALSSLLYTQQHPEMTLHR